MRQPCGLRREVGLLAWRGVPHAAAGLWWLIGAGWPRRPRPCIYAGCQRLARAPRFSTWPLQLASSGRSHGHAPRAHQLHTVGLPQHSFLLSVKVIPSSRTGKPSLLMEELKSLKASSRPHLWVCSQGLFSPLIFSLWRVERMQGLHDMVSLQVVWFPQVCRRHRQSTGDSRGSPVKAPSVESNPSSSR